MTDTAFQWPSRASTVRGSPEPATRRRRAPRAAAALLTLTPLEPTVGAVITGLNLVLPLDEERRSFVKDAIMAYKVVFVAAASRPTLPVIRRFAGRVAGEAAASSPEPLAARLDDAAASTIWADTASALAALPLALRVRLKGRYVAHDVLAGASMLEALTPHPIIQRHPETGRDCLAVDFTRSPRIIGMSQAEGAETLKMVLDLYRDPDHSVAAPRRLTGIALWDGLATAPTPAAGTAG